MSRWETILNLRTNDWKIVVRCIVYVKIFEYSSTFKICSHQQELTWENRLKLICCWAQVIVIAFVKEITEHIVDHLNSHFVCGLHITRSLPFTLKDHEWKLMPSYFCQIKILIKINLNLLINCFCFCLQWWMAQY